MMKVIATLCGITCLVSSTLCAGQDSTPSSARKADSKMQMLERKLTELKAKSGTEWLNISKRGKDDSVQIEQSKENGKIDYSVTISYPFKVAPTNVLSKAGIPVPSGWKIDPTAANEAGEDGQITYLVAGHGSNSIAEFVMSVFRNLFKEEPDAFVFSDETK